MSINVHEGLLFHIKPDHSILWLAHFLGVQCKLIQDPRQEEVLKWDSESHNAF